MPKLVAVIWWPHSGGRWLCRSLLKNHSNVYETVFTHPFLYWTNDMILELDNTSQVHKSRSLPELKEHLNALVQSTEIGREYAIKEYFNFIKGYNNVKEESLIIGEICMGSPIPKKIDVDKLLKADPNFKIIHLIRNPIDSFNSFVKRNEMDNDPVKIASSWLGLNYHIKNYFKNNLENYLVIRYEDLLLNCKLELIKICKFLNIEFEENMIANIKERWGRNTKSTIDAESKEIIIDIAEKELKYYNYI